MKRLLLALLVLGACGDDKQSPDAAPPPDMGSGSDAAPPGATLTTFVIDLVQNQTADNTQPVSFAMFSTLPDPDGDNNNTHAYDPLFM